MSQGDGEVGRIDLVCEKVIGACIEVHRSLGPGLLESAYEQCLCRELSLRSIPFQRQLPLPVTYKGVFLDCGYMLDLIVEGRVVIEHFVMVFDVSPDERFLPPSPSPCETFPYGCDG